MGMNESVLCIPRAELEIANIPSRGFKPGRIEGFLEEYNPQFIPRTECETDPNWKQIIPYVVLRSKLSSGSRVIARYVRGKGSAEERLTAKHSIGFGGHINSSDGAYATLAFANGVQRELNEELKINCRYDLEEAALINDDTTDVGKVHLGFLIIVDLDYPSAYPAEDEISQFWFDSETSLLLAAEETELENSPFEVWSSLALAYLNNRREIERRYGDSADSRHGEVRAVS